ncbi:MAG: S9 family peptidase [Alteromonadaceae bacterium]|uniref:S9 family peptidase n=1 Tax=Paraglaciecola chathamensis TaxID=368405 RepID=UPI000C4DEA66|nr:S9 family peptidase [Paraglaciecola agarilytica]MBN26451.1 S9 family peptidase [Alteromonadaceae bacterium]|tara:strand:+ start:13712 stop:15919 length:2208 start_codon:yes stop_codon:yes gene_type:complete
MKNLFWILLCSLAVPAMATENLTIERIFDSPALEGSSANNVKVSPDGKRVTFLQGKTTDYERYDLWEYNIATGNTQMLFNSDDLHSGPEALSDEEKARRERMRLSGSGIVNYFWSDDGKALLFPLAGDAYYFRLGDEKAQKILDTDAFETDIRFSPKANFISYVREQNLFIKNIKTQVETQLTFDGKGTIKNAMAEFVAQEEMGRMTGYWWSPDESKIAFTQVDEAPVDEITRSEIYADSIKMINQRYPSAGTPNVTVKLAVKDLASGNTQWVDLGKEQDIYLARVNWMKDSQMLTYQWQSRDQKTLELRAFNSQSGKQNTLLTESSNTWVNLNDDLHFLNDQKHFIWASEKSGFKHLYLYKNDGTLVRQLTQGDWVVDEIEAINEKQGLIYFTGRANTPLEQHIYTVSIAGGDIKKLSQRSGAHVPSFSDDASVYVDKFSTVNTPWQVSLHQADGKHLAWLNENAIKGSHPLEALQSDWVEPTLDSFVSDDGTELYYSLYKPKKIQGKHPVIVYVYGGPHAQVVTNSWGGNRGLLMQYWANKGYVVFSVDNRGSNYRGKAFEDPLYKKMGSTEVDDQIAGVKFLRKLPYVDPERIGIYGHSYGGYMSLMSMFKAGEYFKAGVAGAPVTDWALYDTHYTERYMGNPKEDEDAYIASSVFPYAKNLTGDLMIYHGMADDNVLFTNSTKLYKHLQDLAIPFESMDYPGKKHSIRGKQTGIHLFHTITNFFDRHFDMK